MEEIISIQDRMRILKSKFGADQATILDALHSSGIDCTIGVVKNWWQGKALSIKPKYAIALANRFKISREWIENGTGEMIDNSDDEIISINELSLIAKTINSDSIPILFYEDIRASAGDGYINDDYTPRYINLLPSLLPSKSKNIEAIMVDGDSMSGTIQNGDVIFIDKNYTSLVNGKIYVVLLCGEVYVKRLFTDPNTKKLILKSDNPLFPQFEASCEDFKIIGKVIANMNIKEL